MRLEGLTLLLVQIAVVLMASRSVGMLTRRLGQPFVIAEIVAGIALGPSLLGWLWPAGSQALFPSASLPTLHLLSQLGLVLFMFLVGVELDLGLIGKRAISTLAISYTSMALPFALGAAAAWLMYPAYAPPSVPLISFVLFLGISMSVTAFPVLARILAERQMLRSRLGALALACAAADDVSAWCILAVIVALAGTHAIGDALVTCGLTLSFIAVMSYLVRPALLRISRRFSHDTMPPDGAVIGLLTLLLVSSALAELIGIHAVFGAFLLGAVLPREGIWARHLMQRIQTVSMVLLMPLFFAYSGLRTEFALLETGNQWLVAGGLLVCASLGKLGGSTLAARVTGLSWREAGALGILMNTRGLMELVILNIGLDLGVISPVIFSMLVLMALITTAATTPILRWLYPGDDLSRRQALAPTQACPAGIS